MEIGVHLWGIISLAITKRPASSDLAADAITNLMIWAMERIAPLNGGNSSFSERKMCAPAQLRELVLLRNPASEWAQSTKEHVTSSIDDAVGRIGSNII